MRLFLALDIDQQDKSAIDTWRSEFISTTAKAVPAENFHITLSFIGQREEEELEALVCDINNRLSSITKSQNQENITLTTLGLFKKPKVLYLSIAALPSWLDELATALLPLSSTPERLYHPHLTLYRKANLVPDCQSFNYTLAVKSFSLYHSISGNDDVKYLPLRTWTLS